MRSPTKLEVAYHEAGHAVMTIRENRKFRFVSIDPKGASSGRVDHFMGGATKRSDLAALEDTRTRKRAESQILIALAGPLAEKVISGRMNSFGARFDNAYIKEVAEALWPRAKDAEVRAFVNWLRLRADAILREPIMLCVLKAVAEALLEKQRLTYAQVRATWKVAADHYISCLKEDRLK